MKLSLVSGLAAVSLAVPAIAFAPTSGLALGETVTPFHPAHVAGPDAGTEKCPPCTYGNRPAVQVWVTGDSLENVGKFHKMLSTGVEMHGKQEFKAFIVVVGDDLKKNAEWAKWAESVKTGNVGVTWVAKDSSYIKQYKINTDGSVKNTVLFYKDKSVTSNLVNVNLEKDMAAIHSAVMTTLK